MAPRLDRLPPAFEGRHLRHGIDSDDARADRCARSWLSQPLRAAGLAGRPDVPRLRVCTSGEANFSIDRRR